ncbi:MAG: magnesium transporter [Planctomycetales bacterium]|nr:magnesium transporter [Planctomycetales bacterium]NIM08718.1 magnesium transporter [Planctomycetales bacterium]NIN08188.1 magnesium transporter [Planctomycetales bacterium]NIN77316.1 magnesium transporter [Planctomycetales bacterium]NIO34500.1 magnesium transporter [Planctomycetales bacterium]
MTSNPLYLPELREMLSSSDKEGMREFCEAVHPAAAAEFMEGLSADESWAVLQHTGPATRTAIFSFFESAKQVEMIETLDREEMAELIGELAPDDRVDILKDSDTEVVAELMPLVPADERRDILRLRSFPEGTAGAVMTTEFARIHETATVQQALDEIAVQAGQLETIYYLYAVDTSDHLRGVLSARQLLSAIGKPNLSVGEIMERHVVSVDVDEDQEEVADKVARYDLLAMPVVDQEHRLLGIITYDDVLDVMREEAVEDAQRLGAVDPLQDSYLNTPFYTLAWKRGMWLTILFLGALLTALALQYYHVELSRWEWLVLFIPLVISSGGNSGSQSATLIIAALSAGHVSLGDSLKIVRRELLQGLLLGSFLGLIGFVAAYGLRGNVGDALVIPATILLVVLSGTFFGAVLPLLFERLGQDPALMSTPFIAGIIDVLGILIYMTVALTLLAPPILSG